MAEEDEIDILGDYSLDGFLTGSNEISNMNSELDILQCDYSMNAQWLLDSSSSYFYNDESTRPSERVRNISPPTIINVMATRPNASKIEPILGWSTTEIVLLERGLELFGNSAICLSQFIGSKTPNQVKQYLKLAHNNISNTVNNTLANPENLDISISNMNVKTVGSIGDEILDDLDIPASAEEVISIVNSAQPTTKKNEKLNHNNSWKHKTKNNNSRSVLKSSFQKHLNKSHNSNVIKSNKISIKESIIANMRQKFSKTGSSKQNEINSNNKRNKTQRNKISKIKYMRKTPHSLHLITGGGKALPISESEEVIKLEHKSELDSDTDVDIEVDDSPDSNLLKNVENCLIEDKTHIDRSNTCDDNSESTYEKETIIDINGINCSHEEIVSTEMENKVFNISENDSDENLETNISADLRKQLQSLKEPDAQFTMVADNISELEKYFNAEFFIGRPTKTPERYLKIRNHMLSKWNEVKPSYLTKTYARQGLKNCGDVNSIGRIHSVLEQLGAINFNCEQTSYIRPMLDLFKNNSNVLHINSNKLLSPELSQSVRIRKRNKLYENDCEGYTISHAQNIEKPKSTLKLRTHYMRNGGQLMNCMNFTEDFIQPFEVYVELSALICMHFHSITSRNEVMGLVGGVYHENVSKCLQVCKYQPCQTVQQSRIDCEMCPVSQSESIRAISNDGLSVVGWVHSHPGFPPLPSLQDLDTQKEMQNCFEQNGPFLGIIIGPQNSELRCITIPNTTNDIPYEFEIKYKFESKSIPKLQTSLENVLEIVKSYSSDALNPNNKSPYNLNLRSIDKLVADVKIIFNKITPKLTNEEAEQIVNLIINASNKIGENFCMT